MLQVEWDPQMHTRFWFPIRMRDRRNRQFSGFCVSRQLDRALRDARFARHLTTVRTQAIWVKFAKALLNASAGHSSRGTATRSILSA